MAEKKKSVYANIADDILTKIQNDTYKIGSLLPPERELMGIYNVQRTTVRRGLDILSKEGYIKKAAGLGSVVASKEAHPTESKPEKIEYKPTTESMNEDFCVLTPSENLDKLPTLVPSLIAGLNKYGSGFITSDYAECENYKKIVAIDTNPDTDSPLCLALCQSDDKRSVIIDNDKGAYIALSYLEELGHTKIAFIGTDKGLTFENAAYDSFCAVNSFLDEELIILDGANEKSGFDGFSELFRRHGGKFTAVCAVNDAVAKGIIKAAKYYKVNVPEDLSVISLCSCDKASKIDSIFYDANDLADEIIESMKAYKRISTVLFGGSLSKKESGASIKNAGDDEKKMSDFLL